MAAQISGAAACGVLGAFFERIKWVSHCRARLLPALVIAAILCTLIYFVPVTAVDAWLFQPFWPRFMTGLGWSLLSLGSNVVIFPLLFGVTRHLYERERSRPW
jgi:hypothetical protein